VSLGGWVDLDIELADSISAGGYGPGVGPGHQIGAALDFVAAVRYASKANGEGTSVVLHGQRSAAGVEGRIAHPFGTEPMRLQHSDLKKFLNLVDDFCKVEGG
jgi:hypothetical protein